MTTLEYQKKCNKNSDCESNICEMKYNGGEPVGRYCLGGDGSKYENECDFPRDCESNQCVKIYNDSGTFIGKKCLKPKKLLNENTALDDLFGKAPPSKYGVNNEKYLNQRMEELGHRGPISEIIILIFNIFGDLFSILVYNVRACPDDFENQALLYSLFMNIATSVYKALLGNTDGAFFAGLQKKYYDKGRKQCHENARGFDLYYVRVLLTILFPPLGVFMARGLSGLHHIVLTCILTVLFYFPGLIYAFAIMSTSKASISETEVLKNFK